MMLWLELCRPRHVAASWKWLRAAGATGHLTHSPSRSCSTAQTRSTIAPFAVIVLYCNNLSDSVPAQTTIS